MSTIKLKIDAEGGYGARMKYWKDERTDCCMCEPNCADEWLESIWQVGCDYDGCHSAEDLKSLIDELIEMSQKARDCLNNGILFPKDIPNPCIRCDRGWGYISADGGKTCQETCKNLREYLDNR